MPTSEKRKPPEKKISPVNSGISVAIWLNEVQTDNGARFFRSYVAYLVMWRLAGFRRGLLCVASLKAT